MSAPTGRDVVTPNEPEGKEPSRRLDGQVALVIGAAGAIGSAIVRSVSAAGASVFISDNSVDRLEPLIEEVTLAGGVISSIPGDAADPADVDRLFAQIEGQAERLDVLVNAAGVSHGHEFTQVPIEEWRKIFDVNAFGPFIAMQHAVRLMRRQTIHAATSCRGKIINISSAGGERPLPWSVAYGASKAALNSATRSVAAACADDAIAATLIYPGNVRSDLFARIATGVAEAKGSSYERFLTDRRETTPTGAFQDPSNVAQMVVFAASAHGMALAAKTIWTEAHVG
jgi:NAD(P)-dependent dehydrogenase (short-subunit alcohol dehydrogenase family)